MRRKRFWAALLSSVMIVSGTFTNVLASEIQVDDAAEVWEDSFQDSGEPESESGPEESELMNGFGDGEIQEENSFEDGNYGETATEEEGFVDGTDIEDDWNETDSLAAPEITPEQQAELQAKVIQIVDGLELSGKSEYEKVYEIYNYICQNVKYDYTVIDKGNNWDGENIGYGQFAYEALCQGKAVCGGIARAAEELMNYAGVDCKYISGLAENGVAHAWNLVRIGETYYYMDATYDLGRARYTHFLKGRADWLGYTTDSVYDLTIYSISETAYGETAERKFLTIGDYVVNVGVGDVTIYSYTGNEENVVIPSEIGGRRVTRIERNAFYSNSTIKTLVISEGIEQIGRTFAQACPNLETISLPSTVKVDDVRKNVRNGMEGVVSGCGSLRKITVADNSPYLMIMDGLLYKKDGTELLICPSKFFIETVKIPEGVKRINDEAFHNNEYVKNVIFPDTITEIGYWAFSGCTSLVEVTLPPRCEFIGQYAFSSTAIKRIIIPAGMSDGLMSGSFDSNLLEKIEVEEGNPNYYVKDGALYRRINYYTENGVFSQGESLILYEGAGGRKELKIPDNIICIETEACYWATALEKVELGTSLQEIRTNAFSGCSSLNALVVGGNNLKRIGYGAFSNCVNLKNITLPDSVESIGSYAFAWTAVEELILPKNLERISSHSFDGCAHLQSVQIPVSVKEIEENAFIYDPMLKNIFYEGTKEQWDAVVKNDPNLNNVTVHHNSKLCQHEWADAVTVDKEPTCTETGTASIHCRKCGYSQADTNTIVPALGHSWDDWKVIAQPTLKAEGMKVHTCIRCSIVTNTTIPKLTASEKRLTVKKGMTYKLKPPSSWKKVKYGTTNPAIASVNKKGIIQARKPGTVTIVVKSGTKMVVYSVTVPGTTAIKNVKASVTLKKGKILRLKPTLSYAGKKDGITYKSSNKKVATVTSKGVVKGKKKGTATITIKSGIITKKCKIKVK